MKKFLFTLLTAALSFTFASAQQMNYYTNMVGTPGQTFDMAQDTAADQTDLTFSTSTSGAGLTWDFQGLDLDVVETIIYDVLNGQETPEFPAAANLVIESGLGRVVFQKDDPTGLFLMGTGMDVFGNFVGLNYNPPQQQLADSNGLGTTFNTVSFVDEKIYVGIDTTIFGCYINIDTIQIKRISDYTVNFDATGELRLPLDTFVYTLRSNNVERTVDSIFIYSPSGISGVACTTFGISAPVGWSLAPDNLIALSGIATSAVSVDSMFTMAWYDPYTISPICIVDYYYDVNYTDTTINNVRFKATDTPDIGFEQEEGVVLNVYPNPASTILMIQTNADLSNATMNLFNVQGQLVKGISLNGNNVIDVSTLDNGMYFYQVIEGNKLLHQNKIVVKK
jgi:hypothetical protein